MTFHTIFHLHSKHADEEIQTNGTNTILNDYKDGQLSKQTIFLYILTNNINNKTNKNINKNLKAVVEFSEWMSQKHFCVQNHSVQSCFSTDEERQCQVYISSRFYQGLYRPG